MRGNRRSLTKKAKRYFIVFAGFSLVTQAFALPSGFVYLQDIDSTILSDMRYAGRHNFVGRQIHGYEKRRCILTIDAAKALSAVQKELQQSSLSLKVYDCYRPTEAVSDFVAWSKLPHQEEMKAEFYPAINKADFFKLGYVSEQSGHSRGSTVDLTIVHIPYLPQPNYRPGQPLVNCTAPYLERYRDNTVDMGTGYDCMDERSHTASADINIVAKQNRALLREIMMKYGFTPYDKEWWHFTLKSEPFPDTYFNFKVK